MMQPTDPKPSGGRLARIILKAFLTIFNILSFVTFILAAIASGSNWDNFSQPGLGRRDARITMSHPQTWGNHQGLSD
ncbi:hypothetical protein FZEAL_3973 [Fusarium zealandicum]|uniref:Uncharacterized protein n=1 Tax=Fusarium zealandicum TaxID=1053134 RepID=A0A8H4UNI2_9HYPO|nr:hypothetical protein FZEAL_3973 [Fusarium zealandicum]